MEDVFSVAYQQTEDEKDLEYAYFGNFSLIFLISQVQIS